MRTSSPARNLVPPVLLCAYAIDPTPFGPPPHPPERDERRILSTGWRGSHRPFGRLRDHPNGPWRSRRRGPAASETSLGDLLDAVGVRGVQVVAGKDRAGPILARDVSGEEGRDS